MSTARIALMPFIGVVGEKLIGGGSIPLTAQPTRRISLSWLEGQQNWPECAEKMLRNFMVANDFFNYRGSKDDDCQKMDRILDSLCTLFERDGWNGNHRQLLKTKVRNKMARIRKQSASGPLAELRSVLSKIPSDVRKDAVSTVIEAFGETTVRAALGDQDSFNWGRQPEYVSGWETVN